MRASRGRVVRAVGFGPRDVGEGGRGGRLGFRGQGMPHLEDVACLAVDDGLAALEGALLRVAIQLLQQSAAAAKGHVARRIPLGLHRREDGAQRLIRHAIALDDTDLRRKQLVARRGGGAAELLHQDLEHLAHDDRRVARVWPHHQAPLATLDELDQLRAPQVLARVVDVVRVGHHRHEPLRVLRQHVLERLELAVLAPRRDRRVLRRGDRGADTMLQLQPIVLIEHAEAGHGVRAAKVDEVGRTADGRRLHRRHAAAAEVVKREPAAAQQVGL